MVNDPIADMLTRIRNAVAVGHERVAMPASKMKVGNRAHSRRRGVHRPIRRQGQRGRPRARARVSVMAPSPAGDWRHQGDLEARAPHLPGRRGDPARSRRSRCRRVSTSQGLLPDREARRRRLGGEMFVRSGEMSRVGKMPVTVPAGVDVRHQGARVTVKGSRGELSREFTDRVSFQMEDVS